MHSRVSASHILLAWYVMWWSLLAIDPFDRKDWALENVLALSVVGTLIATYRRFRFSSFSYVLITLFMTLHAVGAHYTYAEVPLGFWLKNALSLSRNPFDRIVHFAFGFLLVYPLRELVIRTVRAGGFWSVYIPISGILAQSGFFELVEAFVAQTVSPDLGAAYLGTQGDEWDAQKDMAAALAGAALMTALMPLFPQISQKPRNGLRNIRRAL
jgi:putative membrane protein